MRKQRYPISSITSWMRRESSGLARAIAANNPIYDCPFAWRVDTVRVGLVATWHGQYPTGINTGAAGHTTVQAVNRAMDSLTSMLARRATQLRPVEGDE